MMKGTKRAVCERLYQNKRCQTKSFRGEKGKQGLGRLKGRTEGDGDTERESGTKSEGAEEEKGAVGVSSRTRGGRKR